MDWTPKEDVLQRVLEVLEDTFVPDSEVQRAVQAKVEALRQQPDFCNYLLLVAEGAHAFDDRTRALAALVLKNNIVYYYESIPAIVKQQMQPKYLAMLSDSSREVRLSASVLVNVMVQKEGIACMSNVIAYVATLLTAASSEEVYDAAMKTLVVVTEDHLSSLSYGSQVDPTVKGLLATFIDLTGHKSIAVQRWAFQILNDTLEKHLYLIQGDFDRRAYLEKLISHAIDEHPQIIRCVVQGFVAYVNNQDDTILPAMNDVICYMLTKSVDSNSDVALQACEFWLALSKLHLSVEMLRGHLKTLIPILLVNMRKCPKQLLSPLIKIVIEEVRNQCKKDPFAYGFNSSENAYEPLKLMQSVILEVNDICHRYLDNSMLCSLPSPGSPYNLVSAHAIKNTRRRMEDRHVIINDLNTIFSKTEISPSSYYAIFDGHGGHDAAAYSVAHLHQYLAESKFFASQPDNALTDAFCKTDLLFLEKCNVENFSGGTTALCALLRPKEKSLFIAWVGDSQAIISRQGMVEQCVRPHKPDRADERKRIEAMGGNVVFWGTWRVNGQLAISRAIGDRDYKPHITAEPDVREYALDGSEDFLVMACDGLWDVLREYETARTVYQAVYENPDIVSDIIAQRLVRQAKEKGSTDNISVIVVFLKEPAKIAAEPPPEIHFIGDESMEAGFDSNTASSNPFAIPHPADMDDILASHQKDGFLLDLDGFRGKPAPATDEFFIPANGKDNFDADLDDLGPETDVDAVDDVQSLVKLGTADGGMSEELEEKVTKEIDANLLKSVVDKCTDSNLEHDEDDEHYDHAGGEPKRELVTPPTDEVHDAGLDSDSDDGWNYIKGDGDEDKENLQPSERGEPPLQLDAESPLPVDESEVIDNMSQLNPNAEEFVPVSPTRADNRAEWMALKDDHILAQSPRRPSAHCDFNVPEESDFTKDVKNRPSDVYSNGHENGHKQSSQELMENLLNGKNIEDIEFQPTGSPSKVTAPIVVATAEQFIFGPNAACFSTPTKFMDQSRTSTKANYGDESELDESDLLDRLNKEKDPMSMSFYQEKDDDETPFDVDKEEQNTEEKEQEEVIAKSFDDSISDLPEHQVFGNCETTDLDNKEGICELPQSPVLVEAAPTETLSDLSPESPMHLCVDEPILDLANTSSPLMDLENVSDVEIAGVVETKERRFVTDDEIIERPQEPLVEVGTKSPIPPAIKEEIEDFASHNAEEIAPEPVVCYASREAELFHQEAASEDIISEASDAQQHEFIPETTLEVAQSPEPVMIDNTPDVETALLIPDGVNKYVDEPQVSETCLSPAPVIEPCLTPASVEACLSPAPALEVCSSPEPVSKLGTNVNIQTLEDEHEFVEKEPELRLGTDVDVQTLEYAHDFNEKVEFTLGTNVDVQTLEDDHEFEEKENIVEPACEVPQPKPVEPTHEEVVPETIEEVIAHNEDMSAAVLENVDFSLEKSEVLQEPAQEIQLVKEIIAVKQDFVETVPTPEPVHEIIESKPEFVEKAEEVVEHVQVATESAQKVIESAHEVLETKQDVLASAITIDDISVPEDSFEQSIQEKQREPELQLEQTSPILENPSPIHEALEMKEESCKQNESAPVVEPIVELEKTEENSPIPEITSEVPDILTPVDDITSSVKDESPVEEIKEIPKEPVVEIPELPEEVSLIEAVTPVVEEVLAPVATAQKEEIANVPTEVVGFATAAVAAVVTTVSVGSGVVAEAEAKKAVPKPKTSTGAAAKKPLASAAATKTSTRPLSSTAKTASTRPTAAKPAPASKTAPLKTASTVKSTTTSAAAKAPPKPRAPLTACARPSADKKSLTNGDAKTAPVAAAKVPPIRRPAPAAAAKTAAPKPTTTTTKPASAPTTTRPSVTKSSVTTATKTVAARPATGTTTTAAPKPRPTTLASKPMNTAKAPTTKVLSSSTTTATKPATVKSITSTTAPKPKTTSTVTAKPRVPPTSRPASARAPDAEKQNKENVNKLTASRTAATRTLVSRKPADATKTVNATKATTLNKAPITKKPMAKTAAANKPSVPKQAKEEIVPNGVTGEKEKEPTLIEAADQMIKDLSPIDNLILDNSQIAEATAD